MKVAFFENKEFPIIIWDQENIFKGSYISQIRVIDNEEKEKLKKLGFDLEKIGDEEFDEYCRKNGIVKEKKEEIEDILNNLPYLPQVAEGYYCESIVNKKDVEDLDAEWFSEGASFILNKKSLLDGDWDNYYLHWDGKNYRCYKILSLLNIDAEEVDEDSVSYEKTRNENLDSRFKYIYYKTKDNKFFRVISSPYMGDFDEVDVDWGDWRKIEKII